MGEQLRRYLNAEPLALQTLLGAINYRCVRTVHSYYANEARVELVLHQLHTQSPLSSHKSGAARAGRLMLATHQKLAAIADVKPPQDGHLALVQLRLHPMHESDDSTSARSHQHATPSQQHTSGLIVAYTDTESLVLLGMTKPFCCISCSSECDTTAGSEGRAATTTASSEAVHTFRFDTSP